MATALEKFVKVFNALDKSPGSLVRDLYTHDVVFVDPVHEIKGLENVVKYMDKLYQGVESCQFNFGTPTVSGNEAWYPWTMKLVHAKLHKNGPAVVPGVTFVRIEGEKLSYHRDYFDMGAMIYEHVPVLGFGVKKIKERL